MAEGPLRDPAHPIQTCRPHPVIPGPRGYPLLGVLLELWQDPLQLFMRAAREYRDVVLLPVGPHRIYLLNHPAHVEHVLQRNHRNYRLPPYYESLKPIFGRGLLTSEGDLWQHQRRLLQPGFHQKRIEELGGVITAVTEEMLTRWQNSARHEKPVDVAQEMARLTIEIVVRSLFSTSVGDKAGEFAQAVTFLLETAVARTMPLAAFFERLPTPRNRRFRQAWQTVDEVVRQVIKARASEGGGRKDLFSILVGGSPEFGERMPESQLHDEVKTMIVSGFVTTANALTWIWHLLSRHPTVAHRLRAEIADVLRGHTPTLGHLCRLVYTKMVIQEALRLYPPTWRLARTAIEDDKLGGYPIPAGAIVVFSAYVLHRLPAYWDEPEAFDPERFAPNRSADRPRYAYFPFGGGPRMCIGRHFAMMELQLIVPMVAQRFHLDPVPGQPVEVQPLVTLRPRHGLPMRLRGAVP